VLGFGQGLRLVKGTVKDGAGYFSLEGSLGANVGKELKYPKGNLNPNSALESVMRPSNTIRTGVSGCFW
jgi:hypothetical protein